MSTWTIYSNPLTTPVLIGEFSALSLSNLTRKLVNAGIDEVTFQGPSTNLDVAALFTNGQLYSIHKDSTQWFLGRCLTDPRSAIPVAERISYRLVGPWYYLDKCIYQQQWKMWNPTASELQDQWKGRCVLNQSFAGDQLTVAGQIEDAIDFAISKDAPMQVGTIEGATQPPFEEYSDLSCADIIVRMLRWMPENICWFDYSTTPPTFHSRPRSSLSAASLAIGTSPINGLSIKPRHDLKVPGVVIKYESQTVVESEETSQTYDSIVTDTAGDPDDIETFHATLQLGGARWKQISERITTRAWPTLTDKNWWVLYCPTLKDEIIPIGSGDITFTAGPQRTGENDYDNILVDGTLEPWIEDMGIHYEKESVIAHADIVIRDANANIIETLRNHLLKMSFVSTDAVTKTYTKQTYEAGEPIPSGLAAALYSSWNILHYEGQITLIEAEVSGSILVGNTLNITGGQAAWQTMAALVQTVDEYIDEGPDGGRTVLTIGPARRLSLDDLLSLQKVVRNHRPADSFESRATGITADRDFIDRRGGPAPVVPANAALVRAAMKFQIQNVAPNAAYAKQIDLNPAEISKVDADVEIKAREIDILESDLSGFKKRQVLASAAYGDATAVVSQITVVTAWQHDETNHVFQIKVRTVKVIGASAESAWSTVAGGAGAECDTL